MNTIEPSSSSLHLNSSFRTYYRTPMRSFSNILSNILLQYYSSSSFPPLFPSLRFAHQFHRRRKFNNIIVWNIISTAIRTAHNTGLFLFFLPSLVSQIMFNTTPFSTRTLDVASDVAPFSTRTLDVEAVTTSLLADLKIHQII